MKRVAVEFGFASASSLSRFLKAELCSELASIRGSIFVWKSTSASIG